MNPVMWQNSCGVAQLAFGYKGIYREGYITFTMKMKLSTSIPVLLGYCTREKTVLFVWVFWLVDLFVCHMINDNV